MGLTMGSVSTLLEILPLPRQYLTLPCAEKMLFQPFLRFYHVLFVASSSAWLSMEFQPFLRYYVITISATTPPPFFVSTLLEILQYRYPRWPPRLCGFQPFLRFYTETSYDNHRQEPRGVSTLLEILPVAIP